MGAGRAVLVGVGASVAVPVGVGVGLGVGVEVKVGAGVKVKVGVGVAEGGGVAVGAGVSLGVGDAANAVWVAATMNANSVAVALRPDPPELQPLRSASSRHARNRRLILIETPPQFA